MRWRSGASATIALDKAAQARVDELLGQEVEEAVQLVDVAPCASGTSAATSTCAGSSERMSSWSRSRNFSTRASTRTASPSLEAAVEQLDVAPHAALDAAGRIHELDREVRTARTGRQTALAGDREDALDRPVLGEFRDLGEGGPAAWKMRRRRVGERDAHDPESTVGDGRDPSVPCAFGSLAAVARVKPFRALRFDPDVRRAARHARGSAARRRDPGAAGQAARREPAQRDQAGPALGSRGGRRASTAPGRTRACSCARPSPPCGSSRRRSRARTASAAPAASLVARLRVSPYGESDVYPHERTFRARRRSRLDLLRAVRAKLSPVLLLHDGPVARGDRRARAGHRGRLRGRAQPALARRRPGRDRAGARRDRGAVRDRRRPPPLRDGAALPRGGRHRGVRVHPRRAGFADGSRARDLPDAPHDLRSRFRI